MSDNLQLEDLVEYAKQHSFNVPDETVSKWKELLDSGEKAQGIRDFIDRSIREKREKKEKNEFPELKTTKARGFSHNPELSLYRSKSKLITYLKKSGAKTNATIVINLIKILSEGPAVSLKGSPTVSPTTAAE